MRVLSLFSGGGLGDYGLELAGMETAGQVEWDEYCQKILQLRWPDVPKWRDIHDVTGTEVIERCGTVDVVSGGFPCQPFSVAGKQRAQADDRYLWPEMFRVIREVAPAWVIAENVPGIIKFALDDVLTDLDSIGYATETVVFPAHALGAPHRRDRIWVVGHALGNEHRGAQSGVDGEAPGVATAHRPPVDPAREPVGASPGWLPDPRYAFAADTGHAPARRTQEPERPQTKPSGRYRQWEVEPAVGRVADGVPDRLERLKLLGNGQVVQAAQWIGEGIMNYVQPEKGRE